MRELVARASKLATPASARREPMPWAKLIRGALLFLLAACSPDSSSTPFRAVGDSHQPSPVRGSGPARRADAKISAAPTDSP